MPFVNKEHREKPDPSIPGDRCYMTYEWVMTAWGMEPRWTTVDSILYEIFPEWTNQKRADFLAFLVFFQLHVMPYELKKREENGDIE